MKKTISLLILSIILALTFSACSTGTKEPAVTDIMKEIRSNIDLPDMAEIAKDRISGYYEIDASLIEEVEYIIAGSGVTADEIMVIKMQNTESVEAVLDEMEARKMQIADLFSTYNPDEMTKVNDCVIESKDKYVFFAICNDNAMAKSIFENAFK